MILPPAVVIPRRAACSSCCNPGGRQPSFRTVPRAHPAAIQAVGSRHAVPCRVLTLLQSRQSAVVMPHLMRHPVCASCFICRLPVFWIPRQARYDDLTPRGGDAKGKNVFCRERQILMLASRSCKHPAIIQAVGSRHAALCRVLILLQSRQSVVVMPHRAACSSCCNPGGR